MAAKTFGYTQTTTDYRWAGTSIDTQVAFRTIMPETGTIISIRINCGAYQSTDRPNVWGVVWNRSTGAIISKSSMQTLSNTTRTWITFDLPDTKVAANTPLWIGYSKNSAIANARISYSTKQGLSTVAYNTDWDNSSSISPCSFVAEGTYSGEALLVEVTYKTGGAVKVWNGTGWVEKEPKVWNGSSWVTGLVKVWNGSSWVESTN